jgi:hypothetical protein
MPGWSHQNMRTFCPGCRIENHTDRTKAARIPKLLVDAASQYTWIPAATPQRIGVVREKKDLRFVMAYGEIMTRSVGFAVLRLGRDFTGDEVVFAEPGDPALLGARTLAGLNLTVDAARKRLVAAGPLAAA